MSKRIIYKTDDGGVGVIIPTQEALSLIGIEKIAAKDVPRGKPYKIIEATDLPKDRSTRSAWVVDENDLTDGIGADYGIGSTKDVIGYDTDGSPILRG